MVLLHGGLHIAWWIHPFQKLPTMCMEAIPSGRFLCVFAFWHLLFFREFVSGYGGGVLDSISPFSGDAICRCLRAGIPRYHWRYGILHQVVFLGCLSVSLAGPWDFYHDGRYSCSSSFVIGVLFLSSYRSVAVFLCFFRFSFPDFTPAYLVSGPCGRFLFFFSFWIRAPFLSFHASSLSFPSSPA